MRLLRPCLLALVIFASASAVEKVVSFKKPNLVWDGDTVTVGEGWAKAGGDKPASFTADGTEAAAGKTSAKLHLVGASWVRAGWRWTVPSSKLGFNAKPFTHLYMAVKAKPQSAPGDVKIHLVGIDQKGGRGEGPAVSLNDYAPKALGGGKAWIEVLIPISALTADKDFDATNINEVMFVANGGPAIDCDLYIDNIGFTKAVVGR